MRVLLAWLVHGGILPWLGLTVADVDSVRIPVKVISDSGGK